MRFKWTLWKSKRRPSLKTPYILYSFRTSFMISLWTLRLRKIDLILRNYDFEYLYHQPTPELAQEQHHHAYFDHWYTSFLRKTSITTIRHSIPFPTPKTQPQLSVYTCPFSLKPFYHHDKNYFYNHEEANNLSPSHRQKLPQRALPFHPW